ncbi:MAG: MotA/TolQ/ExbB proton channel family protein [Pseudomonadota bacterium]
MDFSALTFNIEAALAFLARGGPALWVIGGLSVLTMALILWKVWRLTLVGAWARRRVEIVIGAWIAGRPLPEGGGVRARFARDVIDIVDRGQLTGHALREEVTRVALGRIAGLRTGLRALDLIVTIAPLVGLLGTVLGMIEAFQALQDTGARADPAVLAGGIWEALLTTAAGMAVAIPAAVALSWFESVADSAQHDLEDIATRLVLTADRWEAA